MIVYSMTLLYAQKQLLYLSGSDCRAGEGEELWGFWWHFQSLRHSVALCSLVLLDLLRFFFFGPGKKLFPSLAWRSCSSCFELNLSAALR